MECPTCQSQQIQEVYTNMKMPYSTHLSKEYIDLHISYCLTCKAVFQSSAYSASYDALIKKLYAKYDIYSLYNFPTRNIHHDRALDFISDFIKNSIDFNVLEIGSNRGDFSYLVKEKFPSINIVGCEPSSFDEMGIPTVNSFYSPTLFNTKFDLIILRHTLEHIKYPQKFVDELIPSLQGGGHIFIEVPHLINSLHLGIEDFTPDHVNYFTPDTLNALFKELHCTKMSEEGYLYMLFSKNKASVSWSKDENIIELFDTFNHKLLDLEKAIDAYQRVIFYGIGNFYMWSYERLKEHLIDKQLFYKDDNVLEDKLFNLEKISHFEKGDLVILCSSNQVTQEKMRLSLPKYVDILLPWREIIKGLENV